MRSDFGKIYPENRSILWFVLNMPRFFGNLRRIHALRTMVAFCQVPSWSDAMLQRRQSNLLASKQEISGLFMLVARHAVSTHGRTFGSPFLRSPRTWNAIKWFSRIS